MRAFLPPAAWALRGWLFMTQLTMSITWMFCSTRMSPESARSNTQFRMRASSGAMPGVAFRLRSSV